VIFFDETFTRKFRQKVANFRAKIFQKLLRQIFVDATLLTLSLIACKKIEMFGAAPLECSFKIFLYFKIFLFKN